MALDRTEHFADRSHCALITLLAPPGELYRSEFKCPFHHLGYEERIKTTIEGISLRVLPALDVSYLPASAASFENLNVFFL